MSNLLIIDLGCVRGLYGRCNIANSNTQEERLWLTSSSCQLTRSSRLQGGRVMFAKIRHLAMYTHNYGPVTNFYQTVFGMKRMTSGTVDESGKQDANRGHISDGVIGMAILSRYSGIQSGIDHYGFEVTDIKDFGRRMEQHYPNVK